MNDSIPISIGPPSSEPDELRTLVELDRRRGSVGIHFASDMTRQSRAIGCLWLDPAAAGKLAEEILAAVRAFNADREAAAWTEPQACGDAR